MRRLLLTVALAGCGMAPRAGGLDEGPWVDDTGGRGLAFAAGRYTAQRASAPPETGRYEVEGNVLRLFPDRIGCGPLSLDPMPWRLLEGAQGPVLDIWWPTGLRSYQLEDALPPAGDACPPR